MLSFELSEKTRCVMREGEPAVKAALCIIANRTFGVSARPQGVYICGGGVHVNGKDIAINSSYVLEDNSIGPTFQKPGEVTSEERAVVYAIGEVSSVLGSDGLAALEKSYGSSTSGNTLTYLMQAPE